MCPILQATDTIPRKDRRWGWELREPLTSVSVPSPPTATTVSTPASTACDETRGQETRGIERGTSLGKGKLHTQSLVALQHSRG